MSNSTKRGPRTHEVDISEIEKKAMMEAEPASWRESIFKGLVFGVFFYLIQLVIFFILYYIYQDYYLIQILNFVLFMEAVFYFMVAGMAIWFEASPSWIAFKATVISRKFEPKTSTDAIRVAAARVSTATFLLIMLELQGVVIRSYFG